MKKDWNDHLYLDARYAFLRVVTGAGGGSSAPQLAQSERLDLLVQFDVVDLRLSLWPYGFVRWLCQIWKVNQHQFAIEIQLCHIIVDARVCRNHRKNLQREDSFVRPH